MSKRHISGGVSVHFVPVWPPGSCPPRSPRPPHRPPALEAEPVLGIAVGGWGGPKENPQG